MSLVLPTTIFQPLIDPHDGKGEKQDSAASLISCLSYVGIGLALPFLGMGPGPLELGKLAVFQLKLGKNTCIVLGPF